MKGVHASGERCVQQPADRQSQAAESVVFAVIIQRCSMQAPSVSVRASVW